MNIQKKSQREVREELKQARLLRDRLETKLAVIWDEKRWIFEERFLGVSFSFDAPLSIVDHWRLTYACVGLNKKTQYHTEPVAETLGEEFLARELRLARMRVLRGLGKPIKKK
jgi:hypothetical protein